MMCRTGPELAGVPELRDNGGMTDRTNTVCGTGPELADVPELRVNAGMTDRTNMVTAAATVKTACRTNNVFPYPGLYMYFFLSVDDQAPKNQPAKRRHHFHAVPYSA
jgi:hypothetical protein